MNVLLSSKDGYLSLRDFFLFIYDSCPRPELVLIAIRQSFGIDDGIDEMSPGLNNNEDVPLYRDTEERSRQRYSGDHGMEAQT